VEVRSSGELDGVFAAATERRAGAVYTIAGAYAERVIGSARRECLDHVVVIGERHLREILSKYVDYYNGTRTLEPRSVRTPSQGRWWRSHEWVRLHHEYPRTA